MTVFTYSQARQKFALLLRLASKEGAVLIKRKDGALFTLKQDKMKSSPLNVKSVKTGISTKEIIGFIKESRQR